MITPGMRVTRDQEDGLWPATSGFAVRLADGTEAVLTAMTAVGYTDDSPFPKAGSRCTVGVASGLALAVYFRPTSLVTTDPVRVDIVPVPGGAAGVGSQLPGVAARPYVPAQPGDDMAVRLAVARDDRPTSLQGRLSQLASEVTKTRSVSLGGGVPGVTYGAWHRLACQGLREEDIGAAVYREGEEAVECLGIILLVEAGSSALVANLTRILGGLPSGTELMDGGQ